MSPQEKSTLVNETKWQYYGTPGTAGNLTLTWNPKTLQATHVNIEVWGYNETGTSAATAASVLLLCNQQKMPCMLDHGR